MSKAVDAVSKVFSAVFKPISKILAPGIDKPKAASDTGNTKQTIRSGKEPAHFIYGRTATGGLLFWAQEEPGGQDKREKLHLAYLIAEGEIDGIEQVYVNQEPVSQYGNLVDWELHVDRSTPDPFMLANCPDWKESQIGRGVSWVRVTLTFDKDKFATGIPDMLFVVRGNRKIYDPRTGQTGYSENAVLCTLDYVRNRLGVADQFIVWDAWSAAANIADESVADPDGVYRKRYAIGGVYKADQRKDETLAALEENFGGTTRRVGGYWGVEVGAYYGPAVATITGDMVIGSVTGRTEVSRRDAINSVAGKWNSPTDLWEETSYPTVTVAEWVAEDGGENTDTLDTPFSPSNHQSQRLANIKLRRQRAGGQLEIPLNHAGYQFRPGRVINVDLPTINVSGEFKVLEWRFGAKQGSTVVVRQESAGFYDDAVGEPFDYLSIIQTPTGGIGSPTNLRYTVETIGEVVQGRLTWDPVNAAIDYNVVILRGTEVVQAAKTPSGATTCTLSGLGAGDYTANVTARGLQSTSGPATIAFSVLNPPQPARVITQVDRTNVLLVPVLADGDSLGGGTWEYRWGVTNVFTDAEYLGRGDTITHTGRSPGQVLYYWVRGINAYGASDWFAVSVMTSNSFKDEIAALNDDLRKPGGIVDKLENGQLDNAQAISDARQEFETGLGEASDQLAAAQGRIDEISSIANSNAEQVEVLGQDISTLTGRTTDAEAAITETQRIARLNSQLEAFESKAAQVQTAAGAAAYTVERIQRVGADEALSQVIEEVDARLSGSIATVRTQVTSLVTTSESLADSLTQLTADFGDTTAEFESRITALSTTTEGLVAETSRLSTALDDAEASIDEVRRVQRLNAQLSAFESKAMQVQTTAGAAEAKTQQIVSASGRQALAQQITELDTRFGTSTASINSQLTTLSTQTSANATRQDTFEAQVGDQFGSVQQSIGTIIDPDVGVVSQALTIVEVNGKKGIMGIQAFGESIQFVAVANQFAVYNPVAGEYVLAFVVTDGRVVIPDARIDKVTMNKLIAADGSLAFVNGKLRADLVEADKLKVQWANVQNISIGTAQIQSGAIGSAQIKDASITSAKIGALQVDTAKIADQAITISSSDYNPATVRHDTSWRTVCTLNMDPQGQPMNVMVSFSYEVYRILAGDTTYSRASLEGRMVAGSYIYDFEASYGYIVDERRYEGGTFRVRSMRTVPRKITGWTGNRTVYFQIRSNQPFINQNSQEGMSTWQHFIELEVTKK